MDNSTLVGMGKIFSRCLSIDYSSRYGHELPLYLDADSGRDPTEQCCDCFETFFEAVLRGVSFRPISPRRHPEKAMETYEVPMHHRHHRHLSIAHMRQPQTHIGHRRRSERRRSSNRPWRRVEIPTFLFSWSSHPILYKVLSDFIYIKWSCMFS